MSCLMFLMAVVALHVASPLSTLGTANVLNYRQSVFGKNIPAIIRPMVFWARMHPVAGTVLAKIFAEISLNRFVAG